MNERLFAVIIKRLRSRAEDIYLEFGRENDIGCAVDIVTDEIENAIEDDRLDRLAERVS
jgi:hypothetical protein